MSDYEQETKLLYQNDAKAESYHREFTTLGGLRGRRFRFIARKERQAVQQIGKSVLYGEILDAPCGTGKMAEIFKDKSVNVTAGDISPNMLRIAKKTYEINGINTENFLTVDLENLSNLNKKFDVHVCFRLMHRVPNNIKMVMLSQISKNSKYAIVSFGLQSPFLNLKHVIKNLVFRDPDAGYETRDTRKNIEKLIAQNFEILEARYVAKFLSSQIVYLLKSKYID